MLSNHPTSVAMVRRILLSLCVLLPAASAYAGLDVPPLPITPASDVSGSAGGVSSFSRMSSSSAGPNVITAKAAPGRAYTYQGCNTTASTIYLRLYNTASAGAVTVGTTAVFAGPYAFPANTCIPATPFAAGIGIYASTGITYAFGTTPADNDTTTIGAGAITAFQIGYQ